MEVIDIVFRERQGYNDVPLRPYYGDATPELVADLERDTRGGSDITPAALSRVAGRMIRPVGNHQGRAIIANGWGEKRLMFIMSVLVRKSRTDIRTLEISGYTDHVGAAETLRGIKLSREMAMYFNSVTEINQSYMETPTSRGWRTSVGSSNHLITPQILPDFSSSRLSAGTLVMRPEDIFHNNPKDVIANAFSKRAAQERFVDMRNAFPGKGIRMSSRYNDSSTRYMHRSLNALVTANEGEVFGSGHSLERDTGSILKDARSQLREKTTSTIPTLAEIAAETNILSNGFITYGELVDLNPDYTWDDVKVYFMKPNQTSDHSDRSGWVGKDNSTIAATQIARALPAYMAFHHMGYVEFSADNMSALGEPVIVVPQVLPIIGKRVTNNSLIAFEQRLITELFQDMLPWPDCMFELSVRAGLSDMVHITLKLEGEDLFVDTFPIFSDSLVSPVITNHQDTISAMSSTITDIADSIGSSRRRDDRDEYEDNPSYESNSSDSFNF